jgi:hypothetical protein
VARDAGWGLLWAVVAFFVGFIPTVISRDSLWLQLAGAVIVAIGLLYLIRGSARGRLLDAVEGYMFRSGGDQTRGGSFADPRQLITRVRNHQRYRLAAVALVDAAIVVAGFLVAAIAGAVYGG